MGAKKQEREIVARMTEIRELLAEFGLVLSGYDPGITAYIRSEPNAQGGGWAREPISLDHSEWKWIEPLFERIARASISYRST